MALSDLAVSLLQAVGSDFTCNLLLVVEVKIPSVYHAYAARLLLDYCIFPSFPSFRLSHALLVQPMENTDQPLDPFY